MDDDFLDQWAAEYSATERRYLAQFGRKPRNQSSWLKPDVVLFDMKKALNTGVGVVYPKPPKAAVL